jgi:hypothetical protein
MQRRDKGFANYKRRNGGRDSGRGFGVLIVLILLAPMIFLIGNSYLDAMSRSIREQQSKSPPTSPMPSQVIAAPDASSAPSRIDPMPAAETSLQESEAVTGRDEWTPQIAYQHYGKGYEVDPKFLATHIDWLMMKYGMEDVRKEVLDLGYEGPLLQYTTAFQILGPGPYLSSKDTCKNDYTPVRNNPMWTKDFCEKVHPHENWFLHNGKGERLYNKARNWDGTYIYDYYMNPAAKGFREFWVDQMKRQDHANWQGYFLDNVAVDYKYLRTRADNEDGRVREYDNTADWRKAMAQHLQHIKQEFPNFPIWGNMIEGEERPDVWDMYMDHLDGFQQENFATGWVNHRALSPQEWDAMLQRAEKALAKGKSVLLYGQGEEKDYQRMRFSLASYLLVASGDSRAFFRYAYNREYEELWWYPEYEINLGQPEGKRYRKGKMWLRDFQCGRVTVNPVERTGLIEQHPCDP